jgi:hypothetical protein
MHEILNIQTCPICHQNHSYKLIVETEKNDANVGLPLKRRRMKFQGAFPCPVEGKQFRGSATIMATPGEAISSVKILEAQP